MRKLAGLGVVTLALLLVVPTSGARAADGWAGAVYTMTNAASGNEVLAYPRSARGALGDPTAYATGGDGTGGGLGNQSGLILSQDGRWLLVVNAGSNDISVFAVTDDGLELMVTADSRGTMPVSLTENRGLVYVLNAGGDGNVAGFRLRRDGKLGYVANSTRPLSGSATGPAQVGFDPRGRVLVITEKATGLLDTYVIGHDGRAISTMPQWFASPGATPFGFDFGKRHRLFVSEANGGAGNPGGATASSWKVRANGSMQVISGAVPSGETAACWLLVSADGRFAYTTNTPSGSVSLFRIRPNGKLKLRDAQAAMPGGGPIDMAFSSDGRHLYTLNSSGGTISILDVGGTGRLRQRLSDVSVPEGANGLAAR